VKKKKKEGKILRKQRKGKKRKDHLGKTMSKGKTRVKKDEKQKIQKQSKGAGQKQKQRGGGDTIFNGKKKEEVPKHELSDNNVQGKTGTSKEYERKPVRANRRNPPQKTMNEKLGEVKNALGKEHLGKKPKAEFKRRCRQSKKGTQKKGGNS